MSIVERLFHIRNKDIKTVEGQTEHQAEIQLQSFLDENYKVIRAMRSHSQIVDGGMHVDPEQLTRLETFIEKESSGRLQWFDGALCQISDYREVFQHHGIILGGELGQDVQMVRGFYFVFCLNGKNFECVDLDGGGSRKYFDQKDVEGKREFMRRFAERRRNWEIYIGDPKKLPFGFTAFITDVGGKFDIEDVVSYRDSTRPSKRKRK